MQRFAGLVALCLVSSVTACQFEIAGLTPSTEAPDLARRDDLGRARDDAASSRDGRVRDDLAPPPADLAIPDDAPVPPDLAAAAPDLTAVTVDATPAVDATLPPDMTCVCAPLAPCQTGGTSCDSSGACIYGVAVNGTPCDDGDACTQTDTCMGGQCLGANPRTCPTGPIHRWSFTTDGHDSVGTADASLQGGATIANGALVLDGAGAYASLPIGADVGALTSMTVEAWLTWPSASNQTWARVFDFGTGTTRYLFLTPRAYGTNHPRFATSVSGYANEDRTDGSAGFPTSRLAHVAITLDATAMLSVLYVDGVAVGQNTMARITPASVGATSKNWIGRSQFTADPYFAGSVSELRLFDRALSASEIAASFAGGPDGSCPGTPAMCKGPTPDFCHAPAMCDPASGACTNTVKTCN